MFPHRSTVPSPRASRAILVVDADLSALFTAMDFLASAGHRVTIASTYMEGKQLLTLEPPDMLIVDVRLGAFNGLQLALRRYFTQPDGASIITSAIADRMLEQEAAAIQVPFLVKPIEAVELLTLVDRGLEKDPAVRSAFRRWPRRRISGGFGAKVDDVAAVVIDVSDEGMCLEIPQPPDQSVPVCRHVSLPSFGLSLSVDRVWTRVDTEHRVFTCGAVLVQTDRATMQAWRGFVDAFV